MKRSGIRLSVRGGDKEPLQEHRRKVYKHFVCNVDVEQVPEK